jgi:hypothetical protein
MKLVNAFFKEDPVAKELKRLSISSDSLSVEVISKGVRFFEESSKDGRE